MKPSFPPPSDFTTKHEKRHGIMLCYPYEEKRLHKWNPSFVYVQPKLDGVRCRAIFSLSRGWELISSTGREITHVPHINKALEAMPTNFEYDGELYFHGWNFERINSVVSRTVHMHPDYFKIQFHIFDVVTRQMQTARFGELYKIFHKNKISQEIQKVQSSTASTHRTIFAYLERFQSEGYEGVIVRHPFADYIRRRSIYVMKFKPKKFDTYTIVGKKQLFTNLGYPRNELGAFVCKGNDGTLFKVGTGFTEKQRKEYWRQPCEGRQIEVSYQNITAKGVPRFGVFVRLLPPNGKEEK